MRMRMRIRMRTRVRTVKWVRTRLRTRVRTRIKRVVIVMWVRDHAGLRRSLSLLPAAYLKNAATDSGSVIDYHDLQVPFGRRFRALKLWFVLRSYGVAGLQAHVRFSYQLADRFAALVAKDSRFQLHSPRNFALVCFYFVPSSSFPIQELNALSEQLVEHVNAGGSEIGRAVQQECRDRSRMPSSA
eukprot:TRINITY_DN17242_c0_g1_i1.p1 TRINITY_DN17242_c0_g1~~TRINITY_DN17242_c0_g1_i1.p1  ORF type:complete len:212 (+),score=15.61 TRINITY_DN17242_c0_g1_i1:79-636(+)